MINIKKYNNYINEGRGISNIIKEYAVIIIDSLKNDNTYQQQYDFDYEQLPLMDLRIEFKHSNKNHGEFNPSFSTFEDNKLYNVTITIEFIKDITDYNKLLEIVTHELTHAKEYYEIEKKNQYFEVKIQPVHNDVKYININFIKNIESFDEFYNLIYYSLDDEMNARISQLYMYLFNFNIKDKDILFDKIKEHDNWKIVERLKKFNFDRFINFNIDKLGLLGFINITNEITNKFKNINANNRSKKLYFLKEVNDLNGLRKLYKEWAFYFHSKTEKHINKFKYIIQEVIEDLKGNRPWNEAYRTDKFNYDNSHKKYDNNGNYIYD